MCFEMMPSLSWISVLILALSTGQAWAQSTTPPAGQPAVSQLRLGVGPASASGEGANGLALGGNIQFRLRDPNETLRLDLTHGLSMPVQVVSARGRYYSALNENGTLSLLQAGIVGQVDGTVALDTANPGYPLQMVTGAVGVGVRVSNQDTPRRGGYMALGLSGQLTGGARALPDGAADAVLGPTGAVDVQMTFAGNAPRALEAGADFDLDVTYDALDATAVLFHVGAELYLCQRPQQSSQLGYCVSALLRATALDNPQTNVMAGLMFQLMIDTQGHPLDSLQDTAESSEEHREVTRSHDESDDSEDVPTGAEAAAAAEEALGGL